jgi:hypothetical protein
VECTNPPVEIAFNDYARPGWSTYPVRHFDYGATVIVFNAGTSSKEFSKSRAENVWGEQAVIVYWALLNPGKSHP